jgi:DNA-binding MarR family transcriptional regulator
MTRSVSQTDYETLAAFRYALRQFLHFSEAAAEAAGLTAQQHQALLTIKGFPGKAQVTIGELAERLQIRHHSAVGLVDRLVAQKLVTRETAPGDRRQVYVGLTQRGEQMLEALSAAHREELRRIGPNLKQLLAQLGELDDEVGR